MISTEELTNYHMSAKVVLARALERLLIFVVVTFSSVLLLTSLGGLVIFFEKDWRYALTLLAVVSVPLFIWLLIWLHVRHAARIAEKRREEA